MGRYNRIAAVLAVACFAAAFALTPSEVRSRISPRADAPGAVSDAPPAAVALVAPNGDPFVPRAVDADALVQHASSADALPLPAFGRIGPLPPNAGAAGGLTLEPVASVRVNAIVVGMRRGALIDDGSGSRLVTLGDRVAGTTVAEIDARGVTLGDGRRLPLPVAQGAGP